jgi:histidyl-tRNA synthetase
VTTDAKATDPKVNEARVNAGNAAETKPAGAAKTLPQKIVPLSGFPEWLPEERMVELRVLRIISETFEIHGFAPLETRSVEPVDYLRGGGEDAQKEVYFLTRGAQDSKIELGLHFDLTVPLARYVIENGARLAFPFRRYQVQKSWRGERPQHGRFREFYQADADIIADGTLPIAVDTEMPALLHACMRRLAAEAHFPTMTLRVNNRKVMDGFYLGLGIENPSSVLRIVDKLDKIGAGKVRELLVGIGLGETQADACLALGQIAGDFHSVQTAVLAMGVTHDVLRQGLEELSLVWSCLSNEDRSRTKIDLRIARGLDYYTGTIFEGTLDGHEVLGAVCSGGRYDHLTAAFGAKKPMPGVGASIGVSRILARLFELKAVRASRKSPAAVLVALHDDLSYPAAMSLATTLRSRGIAVELATTAEKYGKQIARADAKGIPYVWFPETMTEPHRVKDIRSGNQVDADPQTWKPAEEDVTVRIL